MDPLGALVFLAVITVWGLAFWMFRHRRERIPFHIFVADALAAGILTVNCGISGSTLAALGYGALTVTDLWLAHVRLLELQYES